MPDVVDDAYVLHAGTALEKDGTLVSAGGRVLSVVATGADLAQARERAYRAVARIKLKGSSHRTDIALAAQRGEISVAL
jgi:phosphoribosylamine--glycine ligase